MQLFFFGGINVYLSQTPGSQTCGPQLCVLLGTQPCVPIKKRPHIQQVLQEILRKEHQFSAETIP